MAQLIDRRMVIALGAVGASALFLGGTRRAAAQAGEWKELAPGIKLRTVSEAESIFPGYAKVQLAEVTFAPGSTIEDTMKNAMVCEILDAPVELERAGRVRTLKPGDVYTCKIGTKERVTNKGNATSVMKVFNLLTA